VEVNKVFISLKIRKRSLLFMLFFVWLLFIKPEFSSNLNFELIGKFLVTYFIVVFLFLYIQNKNNLNWFRIDFLFLIGFSIVHFQWPTMFAISGISPENISRVWVNSNYVNFGVWLSTIGIVAWMIGYSWFRTAEMKLTVDFKFIINKLLILAYLSFFLFVVLAGKDFLSGGVYKGTGGSAAGEGISGYVRLVFTTSVILLTILEVLAKSKNYDGSLIKWIFSLNKFYLLLSLTYILLFLSVGDRGEPIALGLLGLVLIGTYVRPVKLREFTALFFVGAIFMTLISLGRSESTGFGLLSEGFSKFEFQSGYYITLELANSVRTLYMALSNIPENISYFYGQLWIGDILSPFPFAQSFLVSLSNIKAYEMGSASFITYLTFGENPESGEGTSLIGDIYLNFGSTGVVFFMFAFGLFLKKVTNKAYQGSHIRWIIVFGVLASLSFYMSRSGLFVPTRPIIWALLFFLLIETKKS